MSSNQSVLPQGIINSTVVIRGNTTPLPGSRGTGEILPDGRPIYQVKGHIDAGGNYAKRLYKREMVRDEDGTIQYHLRPDGTKRAPMWRSYELPQSWIDYVIDDIGNNMTKINIAFRETAENLQKFEKKVRREQQLEEFLTLLETNELNVSDVVSAIRGMPSTEELPDPVEPKPNPLAAANAARKQKAAAAKDEL